MSIFNMNFDLDKMPTRFLYILLFCIFALLLGIFVLLCLSYFQGRSFKIAGTEFGYNASKVNEYITKEDFRTIVDKVSNLSDEIENNRSLIKKNQYMIEENKKILSSQNNIIDKSDRELKNITLNYEEIKESNNSLKNDIESLEKKFGISVGSVYQLQGMLLISEKEYLLALNSLWQAIIYKAGNDDLRNLEKAKDSFLFCLKKIDRSSLEERKDIVDNINDLIGYLETLNYDNRHEDFIIAVRNYIR